MREGERALGTGVVLARGGRLVLGGVRDAHLVRVRVRARVRVGARVGARVLVRARARCVVRFA